MRSSKQAGWMNMQEADLMAWRRPCKISEDDREEGGLALKMAPSHNCRKGVGHSQSHWSTRALL
jgi:hypothetical protein